MQCPRCGATLATPSRFCPVCGQGLNPDQPAAIADLPTAAPAAPPRPVIVGDAALTASAGPRTTPLASPVVGAQWRRWWWKILLIGTGLYIAVNDVTLSTQNVNLLPQLFMIGTFLVPIVYIAYLYEDGTLYDVSLAKIALIFFFGGVVGTMAATLLETRFNVSDAEGLFGSLTFANAAIVGLSEELAKLIVLLPFVLLARRSYPTVMHGIVLGAAAGMGFAAFESMGYAFTALVSSRDPEAMNMVIRVRSLLAPLGHGTWTAIIAATLWRERVAGRFPLNVNVLVGFLAAVVLHLLWDYLPPLVRIAGVPLMHLILGVIGLLLLRFFLVVAKGGQGAAYQERNLATALRIYAGDLRNGVVRRKQRP